MKNELVSVKERRKSISNRLIIILIGYFFISGCGKSAVDTKTPQTPITTNTGELVAYYPLDNDGNDASGKGNNLNQYGTVKTDNGQFGTKCAVYDGNSNNHFSMWKGAEGLKILDNITIAGWFYIETMPVSPYNPRIVSNVPNGRGYDLLVNYFNRIQFDFKGGDISSRSSFRVQAHTWYFVAAVSEGSQLKLYINGALDSTVTYTPYNPDYSANSGILNVSGYYDFSIGRKPSNTGNNSNYDIWSGKLDEIRIYSKALSSDEISSLYTKNKL